MTELLSFRTEDPAAEEQNPSTLRTRTNLTSATVSEHVGLALSCWPSSLDSEFFVVSDNKRPISEPRLSSSAVFMS